MKLVNLSLQLYFRKKKKKKYPLNTCSTSPNIQCFKMNRTSRIIRITFHI